MFNLLFRKKLREMLHLMGVMDIDDDILDSLQKQLFQFLESMTRLVVWHLKMRGETLLV